MSMRRIALDWLTRLLPDARRVGKWMLPARRLRLCGSEFKDDNYYIQSAEMEAGRVISEFGVTQSTPLLDVGCGVGRLPLGLVSRLGEVSHYRGIDVSTVAIRWCKKYIEAFHPGVQFTIVNVHNSRYNPAGTKAEHDFRLPFQDEEFVVIYLYSVFSHMIEEDARQYLREFRRILKSNGRVFITAFLEENVPPFVENPIDYKMKWGGPLHCVRYEKGHFAKLVQESGFKMDRLEHGVETDGQSGVYLSCASS